MALFSFTAFGRQNQVKSVLMKNSRHVPHAYITFFSRSHLARQNIDIAASPTKTVTCTTTAASINGAQKFSISSKQLGIAVYITQIFLIA